MTPSLRQKLAVLYTLLAGGMDAVTGPWLVLAPTSALAAMGVEPETGRDLVFVSFVGAFVAAVGFSYLWAVLRWWGSGDTVFVRAVWRVTILFRLAAGAFVATHVVLDSLDQAWLAVPAADFVFAAIQIGLLRANWPDGKAAA